MSTPPTTVVYDSDQARRPIVGEIANFRKYRGLIRLLVVRDITVRYKRSFLGVWWTLLNPLLTTAVMYIVFSQIFRFEMPNDEPFIIYLLSGVLLVTFFTQGVMAAGSSIVNSASVLTKVYVPPEVFALSSAAAAGVNFAIGLVPLLLVQLVTGWGIPWTVVLVPLPMLAMLAFVTGLGLLVAAAAVYFYDVLDLTGVFLQLLGYLTPTFYPLSIVPEQLRFVIQLNPVYAYLLVFRNFVYLGRIPPWYVTAAMLTTSVLALTIGVWVFSRTWKRLVVML
jgi:ABC-2 type transport system permease protein